MKDKKKIISLVGMTGCGKTSVGKILAKKLGADFIDIDDEIIARYGEIKKIFAEQGESHFRELEFKTLSEIIARVSKLTLLSCGGGLPTYKPSCELLARETLVIWLRRGLDSINADSAILARPPINGSIEHYKKLLSERYPIYREIADYSFYNSYPQRTAAAIIKKLENDM
jgi:shikimate kinase